MLRKTFQTIDYAGNPKVVDCYFNLEQVEVLEMEVSMPGGLSGHIRRIAQAEDPKEIFALVKDIVFQSYGIKDPGDQQFVKSKEISTAFSQTKAYNMLMMSLVTDAQACADFVNAIMPEPPAEVEVAKQS